MGGIADYSGSLVLEWPLAQATMTSVGVTSGSAVSVQSTVAAQLGFEWEVSLPLDALTPRNGYAAVADLFADPRRRWAGYVLGCVAVLLREKEMAPPTGGLSIAVTSNVPIGSGVASSASLEVAAMTGIAAVYGLRLEPLRLARLCQIVENHVVGAPCGIMDQVTAVLGVKDNLLAIRCRPHDVIGPVKMPPAWQVLGIVSGVRHSVGGSRYVRTRTATFMGKRIIEAETGQRLDYLTELTPEDYSARLHDILPPKMTGAEFIERYGRTDDDATTVDPRVTYSVRPCTRHPIYENHRVAEFIGCLERGTHASMRRAGKLMYASHNGYGSWCGMGCAETDLIVDLVRRRGPACGLYGAKITGGGSGGTVAVLALRSEEGAIRDVVRDYEAETGLQATVLTGSSDGSHLHGVEVL
jgi:L-arabinokinase